jgi:hypothetical protein
MITGSSALQGQDKYDTGRTLDLANAQNTMGNQERSVNQTGLDTDYQEFMRKLGYSPQMIQLMSQVLSSSPGNKEGTVNGVTEKPDNSGYGLLGSLAGRGAHRRAFTGLPPCRQRWAGGRCWRKRDRQYLSDRRPKGEVGVRRHQGLQQLQVWRPQAIRHSGGFMNNSSGVGKMNLMDLITGLSNGGGLPPDALPIKQGSFPSDAPVPMPMPRPPGAPGPDMMSAPAGMPSSNAAGRRLHAARRTAQSQWRTAGQAAFCR